MKAIFCRRLLEFATTLLETWTSMHLGCGKRKKMNGKHVWIIVFSHYIYCVFFLFLPRSVTSFLMFWMTFKGCVLYPGSFFSTYYLDFIALLAIVWTLYKLPKTEVHEIKLKLCVWT